MIKETQNIVSKILLKQGLCITGFDEDFLKKTIKKRMEAKSCDSFKEYNLLLESDNEEALSLYRSLHISYSDFFRNSLTWAVIENMIIPSLISSKEKAKNKDIRIWSAAAASGQEAYSIAILLEEALNHVKSNARYIVLATDADYEQINTAQKGIYKDDCIQNIKNKYLNKYFKKTNDSYSISPLIKKKVEFSVFNLLSNLNSPPAGIFSEFDLILCSNILYYYKDEYRKNIINKLKNSLSKNGYIVSSESERIIMMDKAFIEVYPHSSIFRNNTG